MITGESRPVARGEGDRVVAGTVATDSSLRVRVAAVGDDTALAGIQRLVSEAQESALADARPWPTASPPSSSTWPPARPRSPSWRGSVSATATRRWSGPSRCSSSRARTRSGSPSRS
ncbi:MAG: hypothetical protein U5R31_10950 [Acidimicrobiia bacterium]|nr:hypothetical protein [Acidimicrobiia bacterium]